MEERIPIQQQQQQQKPKDQQALTQAQAEPHTHTHTNTCTRTMMFEHPRCSAEPQRVLSGGIAGSNTTLTKTPTKAKKISPARHTPAHTQTLLEYSLYSVDDSVCCLYDLHKAVDFQDRIVLPKTTWLVLLYLGWKTAIQFVAAVAIFCFGFLW